MNEFVPLPMMESTGTVDLRSTERVYCRQPVLLRTSDDREFEATCTDVNLSGIGVDSDRVLAVGQRLELLVNGEARVPMIVMYRMGQHYGLSALGSFDKIVELLPRQ
jgi:hypothetical protein